jgi:hypothetical protein
MEDAKGDQLSNATYEIMLFKGDIHLNETHKAGGKAAKQVHTLLQPSDYLLRIENINVIGVGLINIPINIPMWYPNFDSA